MFLIPRNNNGKWIMHLVSKGEEQCCTLKLCTDMPETSYIIHAHAASYTAVSNSTVLRMYRHSAHVICKTELAPTSFECAIIKMKSESII